MKTVSVLLLCLLTMACINYNETIKGNGNFISENRTTPDITIIELSGDINVFVRQGTAGVKVEADENLFPYIVTAVNDGKLRVTSRDNVNLKSKNDINVYVSASNLREVKVTGSGNVVFEEKLSGDNPMFFGITGSGDIKAMVNAPRVEAKITGSGNLHIVGETRDEIVSITGSGNFEGSMLKSENVQVKIAGSGDARVFADQTLKASIAGSGSVKYKGNASVQNKINGSGTVDKLP